MSTAYQGAIEDHIRRRQLCLWNKITKLYEVENALNSQVHKWIEEGTMSDKARNTKRGRALVVRHDDTPSVPP